MKGSIIKVELADGRKIVAKVLYANGSTFTVKGSDGYIYEVPSDSDYSDGVYRPA